MTSDGREPPLTPARYREHPPDPVLRPFVACYWSLRGHAGPVGEGATRTVLPDACMDILFNLSRAAGSGSRASQVIGTMTVPLAVREVASLDVLAVRFRPGGAAPFLRIPAHEVTDGTLELADVWGPGSTALWHRLGALEDTEARLSVLEQALLARLDLATARTDRAVMGAVELAERTAGSARVDALAAATGLGHRQLERRFLAVVGIPPKTASRVLRFQSAVAILTRDPTLSLGRVAVEAGYHDQAHFSRDFKELAGVSPGSYRRGLRSADTS